MPFSSKAQQRFMFAHHPEIAKEFAEHTDFEHLPEKKKKKSKKAKSKHEVLKYIEELDHAG